MRSAVGAAMSLAFVLCVSAPSFAQPAAPPPAAAPDGAAPLGPPPAAVPAPPPKRKPWKEWLEREEPRPEWVSEPRRVWYGWQTLLVDGLSMGVVAVLASEEPEGAWFGIGMLMIGSPIVHFAHSNVAQGFGSLAIRLASGGLFVLGAVLASSSSFDGGSDDSETLGVAISVLGALGVVSAIVLDASHFGWEEQLSEERPRAWLTPWLDPERGRVGLGYVATF